MIFIHTVQSLHYMTTAEDLAIVHEVSLFAERLP
jgi:hypothetical protein